MYYYLQSVEGKNHASTRNSEINKLDEICLNDKVTEDAVQKRIQNVCINYYTYEVYFTILKFVVYGVRI